MEYMIFQLYLQLVHFLCYIFLFYFCCKYFCYFICYFCRIYWFFCCYCYFYYFCIFLQHLPLHYFFNSSSLIVVPKFKFVITCLITFLLFTSSLYVDTNFEFTVMSVAVDVVIVFEFD